MSVKHIVLIKFLEATSPDVVAELVGMFSDLPTHITGIFAMECGRNSSREGLSQEFTHAFVLDFVDEMARDLYLIHDRHTAFVAQLKPHLSDVLVFDFS